MSALFIFKGPAMPCVAMFLNLLSQVGRPTDGSVLAEAYHLINRRLTPETWVLAQTHCAITRTAG